jgi:hypothetical protein
MPITTLSSRELNQDVGRAKRAAREGPVIITDRGKPAHVLLSIEAYQKLLGKSPGLIDLLGHPRGVEDIDLKLRRFSDPAKPAVFK